MHDPCSPRLVKTVCEKPHLKTQGEKWVRGIWVSSHVGLRTPQVGGLCMATGEDLQASLDTSEVADYTAVVLLQQTAD